MSEFHLSLSVTEIMYDRIIIESAIPRFCVEGLSKSLDFGNFVLIWRKTKPGDRVMQGRQNYFV